MFLICMIHAVGYVPARWDHWLTNICFVGVLGFVLISGFYGIRFSWSKVFRLEGVGIGCATTVVAASLLFDPANRSVGQAFSEVVRLWKGYWFIHAYVVMMVLAPLTENLFRPVRPPLVPGSSHPTPSPSLVPSSSLPSSSSSSLSHVLPFLFLVYGWSFLMLVPGVQRFVPRTPGLEPFSGITLCAVYLVGRLYRALDLDSRLTARWVVPATVLAGILSACVIPPTNTWGGIFARYNSPTLLVFSVGFFWCFRKGAGQVNFEWMEKILSWVGPSIFSVYLIHCNDYGTRFFVWMGRYLTDYGCGVYLLSFILAGSAFLGGFFLDIPRRLVVRICITLVMRRWK